MNISGGFFFQMTPNLKRRRTEHKILKWIKNKAKHWLEIILIIHIQRRKKYPRKKKCKQDMWRFGFLSGKKTRVWPKKLHFLKIAVFCWNKFDENIAKLVIDNAVCEKL